MRWIVLTFGIALAGCIPSGQDTVTPGTPTADDPCAATTYTHLIGTPATDLPDFPQSALVRVYDPSTDAVTRDYRLERLNIEIDRTQNRVLRLACG